MNKLFSIIIIIIKREERRKKIAQWGSFCEKLYFFAGKVNFEGSLNDLELGGRGGSKGRRERGSSGMRGGKKEKRKCMEAGGGRNCAV